MNLISYILWISDMRKSKQSQLVSSCKLENLSLASKAFLVHVTELVDLLDRFGLLSSLSVVINNLISIVPV